MLLEAIGFIKQYYIVTRVELVEEKRSRKLQMYTSSCSLFKGLQEAFLEGSTLYLDISPFVFYALVAKYKRT